MAKETEVLLIGRLRLVLICISSSIRWYFLISCITFAILKLLMTKLWKQNPKSLIRATHMKLLKRTMKPKNLLNQYWTFIRKSSLPKSRNRRKQKNNRGKLKGPNRGRSSGSKCGVIKQTALIETISTMLISKYIEVKHPSDYITNLM